MRLLQSKIQEWMDCRGFALFLIKKKKEVTQIHMAQTPLNVSFHYKIV